MTDCTDVISCHVLNAVSSHRHWAKPAPLTHICPFTTKVMQSHLMAEIGTRSNLMTVREAWCWREKFRPCPSPWTQNLLLSLAIWIIKIFLLELTFQTTKWDIPTKHKINWGSFCLFCQNESNIERPFDDRSLAGPKILAIVPHLRWWWCDTEAGWCGHSGPVPSGAASLWSLDCDNDSNGANYTQSFPILLWVITE